MISSISSPSKPPIEMARYTEFGPGSLLESINLFGGSVVLKYSDRDKYRTVPLAA
jgi:hypothetical protein